MKATTAYVSEYGTLHQKKSAALLQDARKIADDIAEKQGTEAQHAFVKTFIKLADQEISPRRLFRMYSKLWRARQAFLAALEEEKLTPQEA